MLNFSKSDTESVTLEKRVISVNLYSIIWSAADNDPNSVETHWSECLVLPRLTDDNLF